MRIPKKIKIGPHTYRVKYEKGFLNNHNAYAQSRHARSEMILDPDVNKTQLEDTFLHEILHCIDDQVTFTEKDKSEAAIARLSPRLLEVLKDNKLLR